MHKIYINACLLSQPLPAATMEKQGQLGNLQDKTTEELRDLISRQEAILKHQRYAYEWSCGIATCVFALKPRS